MSCGSPRKRDRPYDVLLLLSIIDTISDRYQAIRCPTFKTLPSSTHRISITPSLAFFAIVNRYHNIRLVFQFDAWLDDWSYSICMMVKYVDTVCWVLTLSFRICEIEKPHRSNWQCIMSLVMWTSLHRSNPCLYLLLSTLESLCICIVTSAPIWNLYFEYRFRTNEDMDF